jgi:dTDP-4-amino-4,6-dideoxygalactose transaminase
LQAQYRNLQAELAPALAAVMETGDFILGKALAAFEEAFARFVGTRHAVGVGSGTDALMLTLKVLGIGHEDKVIIPANTFIATACAVTHCGAIPVLGDVDPLSFNLDMEKVRRILPAGTRAIIPVHLYGQPANMEAIQDFAKEKGLIIVEDAAQAHGAVHANGSCGTLGRAAAFSFYPGKNLGAYGDGGAVCTDDDELASRLRLLRNIGSEEKYVHPVVGYNSRLDSLQAAILLVKLGHLHDWNRKRRLVADWYREDLGDLSHELEPPLEASWCRQHVYHLFVVRLLRADRDRVIRHLRASGIAAGIHYPVPIHCHGAYQHLGHGPGSFPVTERLAASILSLPMYPELTRQQVKAIANHLADALKA